MVSGGLGRWVTLSLHRAPPLLPSAVAVAGSAPPPHHDDATTPAQHFTDMAPPQHDNEPHRNHTRRAPLQHRSSINNNNNNTLSHSQHNKTAIATPPSHTSKLIRIHNDTHTHTPLHQREHIGATQLQHIRNTTENNTNTLNGQHPHTRQNNSTTTPQQHNAKAHY